MTHARPDVRLDDKRRAAALARIDRLPDMLAELLGPRLSARPLCAGRAPEFDLEVDGETKADRTARHAAAVTLCRHCPALPQCRAALPELGSSTFGIWAGVVLSAGRPAQVTASDDHSG